MAYVAWKEYYGVIRWLNEQIGGAVHINSVFNAGLVQLQFAAKVGMRTRLKIIHIADYTIGSIN